MFGPLFRYELSRLARRGLQPKLRAAFAGLLLVALFLAYLAAFPDTSPFRLLGHIDEPLTIEAGSRFGHRFLVAFLFIQAAVVMVVTPVIAAGAIGEEKDGGSLDLLLTTPLSGWEIVAGKLVARLVFVGTLLLTGVPVVALAFLLGGIDPGQLAAGCAIALLSTVSLGAFSLWLSVWCETWSGALVRAYTWVVGLVLVGFLCGCCFSPALLLSPPGALVVVLSGWPGFMAPDRPADLALLVGLYAALHLLVALAFTSDAALRLRWYTSGAVSPATLATAFTPRDDDLPPVAVVIGPPVRTRTVPEVNDADPLGWKEMHFGQKSFLDPGPALYGCAITILPFAYLLVVLSAGFREAGGLGPVFAAFVVFVGCAGLLAVGLRTTGSVTLERRRGTLDGLLTLPLDRREIIFAKEWAAVPAASVAATLALSIVAFGVITSQLAWPAIISVPVVLAGWLVFAVGFGMFLSVVCPTRERAVGWFLAVGIVTCVVFPLLAQLFENPLPLPPEEALAFIPRAFSPVMSLWNVALVKHPQWGIDGWGWEVFQYSLWGALYVAVIGVIFGKLAVDAFKRREV